MLQFPLPFVIILAKTFSFSKRFHISSTNPMLLSRLSFVAVSLKTFSPKKLGL